MRRLQVIGIGVVQHNQLKISTHQPVPLKKKSGGESQVSQLTSLSKRCQGYIIAIKICYRSLWSVHSVRHSWSQ